MTEISVHSDRIREALRLVQHAAATDQTRPILNGIVLEGDEGGFRAIAADNYRIAIADISDEANDFGRAVVPLREIPLLMSVLRAAKGMVPLSVTEDRLTVSANYVSVTVRLITGTFPNYREAINWETEGTRRVLVVNPLFLGDTSRALAKRMPVARIWVGSAHEPLIVESTHYREVIMPQKDATSTAHGIERPAEVAA